MKRISIVRMKNRLKILHYLLALFLWLATTTAGFAETITITGVKVIDKATAYRNVTLNLEQGSFLITNNATLSLVNTKIYGTLSPFNPFLLHLLQGQLIMKNNVVKVGVRNIPAMPDNPSQYNALKISQGSVYIIDNQFSVDTPYTVGLLATGNKTTSDFIIKFNHISGFHGGIFLSNSNHALVADNHFFKVSLSNILTKKGANHLFSRNIILFSGNNGFDILDSNNIILTKNHIFSSSCYSILILRSQDVLLQQNSVTGGKTYAIYIAPSIGLPGAYDKQLLGLVDENSTTGKTFKNSNIHILNNYLAQNRYGLTATNLDGLEVSHNIFVQRFSDEVQRRFWTNNDVLLKDTIHISWVNNLYKEAFPQADASSNEATLKFVEFPLHGGTSL